VEIQIGDNDAISHSDIQRSYQCNSVISRRCIVMKTSWAAKLADLYQWVGRTKEIRDDPEKHRLSPDHAGLPSLFLESGVSEVCAFPN